MSESEQSRAELLKVFVDHVTPILAEGKIRSVMLAVSQYWADEADDAVHKVLVYSERETPYWPHQCDWDDDDRPALPGEGCSYCNRSFPRMRGWNDNGSAIVAFQAWCHENGSQDRDVAENAMPFAIARMREGRVELEQVGELLRGWLEVGEARPSISRDARSSELLASVHAEPRSDDARRVLADHLLDIGDPLGELISLSLEAPESRRPDVESRHAALVATHAADWLGPLGSCVPLVSAKFERGFLRRCDVYFQGENQEALQAKEWGTVEELRFLPGSSQFVSSAMTALRRVGPLTTIGLEHLATSPRPWLIEELHAVLGSTDDVYTLLETKTLPALKQLVLAGPGALSAYVSLKAENPFEHLERVDLCLDTNTVMNARFSGSGEFPVLALCVARFDGPAGWMLECRGRELTLTMSGWSDTATLDDVQVLLHGVPAELPLRVASSRFWTPTHADMHRIAEVTGRDVIRP